MSCVSEDEERERKPVAMVGERRETRQLGVARPGAVRFDVGVGVGGWVSIALVVEATEG